MSGFVDGLEIKSWHHRSQIVAVIREDGPIIATGSVGNPLELPEASYVILEGNYNSEARAPLNIQFIRVPYPIEQAVQDALQSGMPHPEEYILEIRTGRYQVKK